MEFIGLASLWFIMNIFWVFACGWIAHEKGRHSFGHAVGGMLFGPIWLFILIALPTLYRPVWPHVEEDDE